VDLTWSGASTINVDIVRDGSIIATTANDSPYSYSDNIGTKGGATYQYEVCDAGTNNCSNTATVVF
jgi:serine protease